jgi:hypothetical protein
MQFKCLKTLFRNVTSQKKHEEKRRKKNPKGRRSTPKKNTSWEKNPLIWRHKCLKNFFPNGKTLTRCHNYSVFGSGKFISITPELVQATSFNVVLAHSIKLSTSGGQHICKNG